MWASSSGHTQDGREICTFFFFFAFAFSLIRTGYAWLVKFRKDGDEGDGQAGHDAVVHGDDGGIGFG